MKPHLQSYTCVTASRTPRQGRVVLPCLDLPQYYIGKVIRQVGIEVNNRDVKLYF